ncbi:MAG: SDR family NAD(P)-dependent oxidoreductase [Gammaproteobacteria bacterium]|nr:SDR family NAD(P)-dependent oxidoreductase [Gammaproteobacteria bacterium]MYF12002.1 SDR family NAD(P)-dependent oxidoreductase [Gammaproteobacteria bacterium]MYF49990.1 SDR family NAD(P)-dependent oxidoreductase [Gammaproteobacteria bacterium]MYH15189.1 SDR family NAD(P)-dependent oxidoreductase [Gammaproteobacteria bacterium]MYK82436.1 SDR family NAD(P)-dependent oxidoreductase [Gammaproteobacteria bacterium]
MGMLEGKVAVVTGAGGGLGRTHALLLAKEGAAVVVNDLGGARDGTGSGTSMADSVVEEIRAAGGQAIAHYGSVSAKDDAIGMIDAAVTEFGKIDICICNAGILRDKSFKNMTDDMWDVVLDVHLRGTYLVTKAAYDKMLELGNGGRIIMTSSTSGLLGNFGQTNYGAAKAAIAGFMRCLWLEGLKYGVTVNVLAPTAMSRLTEDILPEAVQDQFPPETVSPAVVWLCTDEAKEVTGRQWLVAGNNVSLLSWQVTPIADRDLSEGPWDVTEIGERILASKENWPPINPLRG